MRKILRAREWSGNRQGGARTLGVFEAEGVHGFATLVVSGRGTGNLGFDLTPRQALELSEHLLSFAVRCSQ